MKALYICENKLLRIVFWDESLDECYMDFNIKGRTFIKTIFYKDHWMNYEESYCKLDTVVNIKNNASFNYSRLLSLTKKCESKIIDSTEYKNSLPR